MAPFTFMLIVFAAFFSFAFGLSRRVDTSEASNVRSGILFRNSTQTSCEVVMLNTYTGLVAANCFKNASNIYADKSVYDIYIEGGNGTNPYRTAVVDFSFHSSYDPKTLANNVYGIRFNSPTKYNIDNRLGLNLKDYSKFIFSRKIISDVANMKWTSTATAVTNLTAPSGCTAASSLYAANSDSMICIDSATVGDDGTSCTVPYSQVYGVTSNGTTAIVGMYSHSVVYGDDMCGGKKMLHYYTAFPNLYKAICATLMLIIPSYNSTGRTNGPAGMDFKMASPSTNVSGVTILGGYTLQPHAAQLSEIKSPSDSSSNNELDESSVLESESSVSDDVFEITSVGTSHVTPAPSGNAESSGLPKSAAIAVGVTTPLATLGIIALVLIWYRKWKRRQHKRDLDPFSDNCSLQSDRLDIGGTGFADDDLPPAYTNAHDNRSFVVETKRDFSIQ